MSAMGAIGNEDLYYASRSGLRVLLGVAFAFCERYTEGVEITGRVRDPRNRWNAAHSKRFARVDCVGSGRGRLSGAPMSQRFHDRHSFASSTVAEEARARRAEIFLSKASPARTASNKPPVRMPANSLG